MKKRLRMVGAIQHYKVDNWRWVEHLSEILNRDNPTNPVEEDEIVE